MDPVRQGIGSLRELLGLLRSQADATVWRRLAAILGLAVAGSVLAALAPLALKHLIDSLRLQSGTGADATGTAALWLGAAYLLALACGRVLAEFRLLLAAQTEQSLNARLSSRYFAQLLGLPLAFHTDRSTGALANGLVQATAACQLGLNSLLQCIPVVIETLALLLVFAHLGQPTLAAILAISALAYGLVFSWGAMRLRGHACRVSEAGQQLHGRLADSLLNIEAIQCFNAQPTAQQRFDIAARALRQRWSSLNRHRAGTGLALAFVFALSVGSTLWVSARAVGAGSLSIGGFVLATLYMLQMVRPLELFGMAVRDLAQALEFARPLLDVMHQRPQQAKQSPMEVTRSGSGRARVEAGSPAPELSFRNVHLAFGPGRSALNGLNLVVPAGNTVAIVGRSGAGKSSIARVLLGLHRPTSGDVLWNGLPIERMDLAALRSRVAVVTQDTTLLAGTIADNIALGRPSASRLEIEAASRQAQLHTFVVSLPQGYDTPVGDRGLRLSGGERQRIAIARAILMRPKVYVFDEASSMLDAATEAAVLKTIRSTTAGCTTILITHRLAAARLADQIVVLEAGQAVEQGSHAELLARGGPYLSLWRSQRQSTPSCACGAETAGQGCKPQHASHCDRHGGRISRPGRLRRGFWGTPGARRRPA